MSDESGRHIAFALSENGGANEYYFYESNILGDITAIYDEDGNVVAQYKYDAWGNFTAATSKNYFFTDASLFKYRGYIYDWDTGFYYLQSRYYDPVVGRFINADGYVSTGAGLLGYNMYAYCNNNPVNFVDPSGDFLISISAFLTVVIITSIIVAPVVIVCDLIFNDLDEISESGALYDSERNGNESPHSEQGLWWSIEGGNVKNTEYSAIEASAGFFETSNEVGIFEFGVGLGKVSASSSSDITESVWVGASIEGLYGSAKINIPIGKHTVKIGFEGSAGSVGAVAKIGKKTEFGIAYGIGGSFVIEWD